MKIDDVIHKSIIMELTIKDNIVNNLKSLPFDILSRLTKFKIDCDTDGCDYEQLGTLENVIGKMTNLKLLKLLYSGGGSGVDNSFLKSYPSTLKELYISYDTGFFGNNYGRFPDLPNLKKLTIDGFAIFSSLRNLTHLVIKGFLLQQVNVPTIYDLTNLKYLVIHNYEPCHCEERSDTSFYYYIMKLKKQPWFNPNYLQHKTKELYMKLIEELEKPKPWRFQVEDKIKNLQKLRVLELKNLCVEYVHENVTTLKNLEIFTINNHCDERPILPDNVKSMKQLTVDY